ncbi:ABC transporter type 1, transmembrane domain-containing protein [Cyathus striatus]|nr:ABC transporter type 1, transmembrane domain-containing protein [Cyathus striatus]
MYEIDLEDSALDPRILPLYASSASLFILSLQIAYAAGKATSTSQTERIDNTSKHVNAHRSFTRLSFKAARFLGCLALLALSVVTALSHPTGDVEGSLSSWENIYAYRDFWPLMTTTGTPQDIAEGSILWAKLALITFVAVYIPLFIPGEYVPVDPKDPMEEPNAEQTASTFSGMLYFYLDAIIFKASKVEHLPYDELPVLADYDRARHLREKGFPHLDPLSGAKQSHLFFKIVRAFRARFTLLCLNVLVQVLTTFAAPIGINRVLNISRQAYLFISTGTAVQAECLITQLVFEHSLRVRVKAETSGTELAGDAPQTEAAGPGTDKKKTVHNMTGKMNNLVTSDLASINGARDFLILGNILPLVLYVPLQIILGIVFLYNVLGISAFVCLVTMVALMPVPRLVAKKLTALQAEKMKLTDARVQAVTETVSSLRMLKLFAWESKMSERIQESRKSEMDVTWKIKIWSTLSDSTNEVIGSVSMLMTFGFYTIVMKQQLDAKVALDRLDSFLRDTELLDAYDSTKNNTHLPVHDADIVGFKDCIFSWAKEEGGTTTPSFKLHIPGELFFRKGCEMHFIPSVQNTWFNLPRNGGVAYASQESWVMNETIKNNVLFGSPFDEERYNKVLQQCALKQDLELFDAGDETEVGERGLTLRHRRTEGKDYISQGRVLLCPTQARAKWIVEECLLGDLIKGRTVLLVTHNVALTEPIAHFIISIGSSGSISARTLEPMDHLPKVMVEELDDIPTDIDATRETAKEDGSAKPSGKLIVREEVHRGRVGGKAMKLFLSALGGKHPFVFFFFWILALSATQSTFTFQPWFLGYWGSQYEKQPTEAFLKALYYNSGTIRASRVVHDTLMGSILDGPLPMAFSWVVDLSFGALTKLGSVVIISPIFIFPGVFIAFVGSQIANIYLKAQLSVKREMSNAKAPVVAHFGATVNALVSVRAYGAQEAFRTDLLSKIDHYSRVARMSWDLNRWMGTRMDLLGATFTTALALYLVMTRSASAANTGFSLTVALEFCRYILGWVRLYNDFEVQSNSLERIQSYLEIDQEKCPTDAGKPPAAWPTSGELRVEKLSARYSADSPEILHKCRSKSVPENESVLSTLTLSLLRCILTEGHVYYDGLATDKINLDALRSNITIIPQVPELLSGTLRRNLDPFGEHDDAELNAALKYAGLFSLQSDSDEARITLDTKIASGGSNISVGQRQIIALARAMQLLPLIVLDAGNLVEFDSPSALLQKEGGIFKGLVDNSGHSDELRAIAFRKAQN